MEGLLLTVRMMCLEGSAPSSTRDLVTRPEAGLPASIINFILLLYYYLITYTPEKQFTLFATSGLRQVCEVW